eukprot:CAMPEP_0204376190 /NCGR_PEP_ID=MMETSP0469-20131031/49870_1 /ASSEMBLY_ACC=CAM_ASM_000384 /TAXON_ID=2969 /ORGANISM="Oxyrrhis marina" /LENGTH=449 /DNA_ID=CAMNT_0051367021 /DNA_START=8 /DNA_END=1357 /DNA_ORIENTATION=-
MAADAPNRKVVLDAGAMIMLQRVDKLGTELFTTEAVLAEVKDKRAQRNMALLPYDIKVMEPSNEDILFVRKFARGTGDLPVLSDNDLGIMALTLTLQRTTGEVSHLNREPKQLEVDEQRVSFAWGPNKVDQPITHGSQTPSRMGDAEPEEQEDDGWTTVKTKKGKKGRPVMPEPIPEDPTPAAEQPNAAEVAQATEEGETVAQAAEQAAQEQAAAGAAGAEEGGAEQDGEEDSWDEDDLSEDGEEWVTEENIHRFGMGIKAGDEVKVACCTGDYAMQNVMKQVGLYLLTIDGYAITTVRLWGKLCRGPCGHFTRDASKMFCPKCGHANLSRVPITIEDDGSVLVHLSKRPAKLKGTIYFNPPNRGGRNGRDLLLAEDQLMMGSRARILRQQQKQYERDLKNRDPFSAGYEQRGWDARKLMHGAPMRAAKVVVGWGNKNPNDPRSRPRRK